MRQDKIHKLTLRDESNDDSPYVEFDSLTLGIILSALSRLHNSSSVSENTRQVTLQIVTEIDIYLRHVDPDFVKRWFDEQTKIHSELN